MILRVTVLFIVPLVFLLSYSWNNRAKNSFASGNGEHTDAYTGPIIDMHIHVFPEGHPPFGMMHPPTLRRETYEGVASSEELKKKTLAKFREHNIVKAVTTDGHLWFDDVPEIIFISKARAGIDILKYRHSFSTVPLCLIP